MAKTYLACDDIPYDEVKEIFTERSNEVIRKLDKKTEALKMLSETSSTILRIVNQVRRDMRLKLNLILNEIQDSTIKSKVSTINNIVEHFVSESGRLKKLPKDEFVSKLNEENGILTYLLETPTPKGLNAPLFDIIENNNAVPKKFDDDSAFEALFALVYGTQTYIAIMYFLLEQHSYLADYYYQNGELGAYNTQFSKTVDIFETFTSSLSDQSTGLIPKVIRVLKSAKDVSFKANIKNSLYGQAVDNLPLLEKRLKTIENSSLPLNRNVAPSATVNFEVSQLMTPIGEWEDGRSVRYAVQLEKNGIFTKIGKWSNSYTVNNKACPAITVNRDAQNSNRLVFRKFDNEDEAILVGVLKGSKNEFRDLDRDFYEACGHVDKEQGLQDAQRLLNYGAIVESTFELGRNSIHQVFKAGNIELLAYILERKKGGVNMNIEDNDGYTPYHLAAEAGLGIFMYDVVTRALDINKQTYREKYTAYHIAAMKGFRYTLFIMGSNRRLNRNLKSTEGFTALHFAVSTTKAVVHEVADAPEIDVNPKSNSGLAPIHLAVMLNKIASLNTLLDDHRTDVNISDDSGLTALHYAAMIGNGIAAQSLMDHKKANLSLTTKSAKWIPLHVAIYFKHVNVVDKILSHAKFNKSDINKTGDLNITPLHIAAAKGESKLFSKLVSLNGDIAIKLADGSTMLHVAALNKNALPVIKYLVEQKNVDKNAKNNDGNTPLHEAVKFGCVENVKYLLQKGADRAIKNKSQNTAQDLANTMKNQNIIDLFNNKRRRSFEHITRSTQNSRMKKSNLAYFTPDNWPKYPKLGIHSNTPRDGDFAPFRLHSSKYQQNNFVPLSKLPVKDPLSTFMLLDILFRKYTKEKYNSIVNSSITELDARVLALKLTETFEKAVKSFKAAEKVDSAALHSKLYKSIRNGRGKRNVLLSYVDGISMKPENKESLLKILKKDVL